MRYVIFLVIYFSFVFQVLAMAPTDDVDRKSENRKRNRNIDNGMGDESSSSQDLKRQAVSNLNTSANELHDDELIAICNKMEAEHRTNELKEYQIKWAEQVDFWSDYILPETRPSSPSSSSEVPETQSTQNVQQPQEVPDEENQIAAENVVVPQRIWHLHTLQQHRDFIKEAFETAQERIVFCSPFINYNSEFLTDFTKERIESALNRGVQVVFVVGQDRYIHRFYTALGNIVHHNRFRIISKSNFHYKTVVVDNRMGESSFNWFSASRDHRSRYYNHEATLLCGGPEVAALIDRFMETL